MSEIKDQKLIVIEEREESEDLLGKYTVSNEFIRNFGLFRRLKDVQSQKLLGLILAKIREWKDVREEPSVIWVSCQLVEINRACGLDRYYKNMKYYKDMALGLHQELIINVKEDDAVCGNLIAVSKRNEHFRYHTYDYMIPKDLLAFVKDLTEHFTIVDLDKVKNFKSRFSYLLYLELLSWNVKGEECKRYYTTQQLKELFGLDKDAFCGLKDGKFRRYDFEKKTILKAVEEINKQTGMLVECRKIKSKKDRIKYEFKFYVSERTDFDA